MTENEAIEVLEERYLTMPMCWNIDECKKNNQAISAAITALKQIIQYRSIGTVEECRAAMEKMKQDNKNSVGELMKLHNKTYPCKKQTEVKVSKPHVLPELNRGDSP